MDIIYHNLYISFIYKNVTSLIHYQYLISDEQYYKTLIPLLIFLFIGYYRDYHYHQIKYLNYDLLNSKTSSNNITEMVKNYYQTLCIKRDASEDEIAQAYKKLSLRWHPKLTKEDQKTSFYHFCQISEAYEVLSDQVKRAFYDKFGQNKLKDGFFAEGELKGGYRFANNPSEIFDKFFTSNNVLSQVFDNGLNSQGSMFGYAFGGQNYSQKQQLNNLQVKISCSLSQLYNGCSYPTTFKRTVVNLDGKTTSQVQISKQIEIKPGSSCNSIIEYQNQGHELAGSRQKSKLIFKIVEESHPRFKRVGDDLIYTADILLIDALNSESVEVRTLDNRQLLISFDEIINPKTVKEVQGQGMPIQQKGFIKSDNYGSRQQKGNLYIKFNIIFPQRVTESQKIKLKNIL